MTESIAWDAPETILACRMLFRQRAVDESPEDFLRPDRPVLPAMPGHPRDQSTARPTARRQRMTHRKDTPMSDPTKIHVHTSTDGPCGYCSGDDCPMRYCPGCPPGCPLAEDEPDEDHDHHSDVRSVSPARDAVSDAEAAQWAALADAATEGPWVVDSDGSIGAPMAGLVCGEAGHPRLDCSECGTRVCHVNVMPGEPDAAFIAAARTAVPRLLVERERLVGANARMRQVAELRVGTWRDTAARLEGERDRARGTAATLEAENARLREGIEAPAVEWEARVEPCSDRVRHMLDDHANALYALLDELGERFGAPRALEEAEPGDHPDSEGDNVPSLDAITRDPAVQDAVLAALVEGGRLVEELELSHCPWLRCERDLSGECLDEACRVVTRRRVRLVEPEWRDAQ